jgi:hypothetical protein
MRRSSSSASGWKKVFFLLIFNRFNASHIAVAQ